MAHREIFRVGVVSSGDAQEAFGFHSRIAASNAHIWPRNRHDIENYIAQNCLFGVWKGAELVALAYVILDESSNSWELGGITVDAHVQGRGVARLLVRFALLHTFVFQDPWKHGQDIIAHVHEANDEPRKLLVDAGFRMTGTVPVPPEAAPASMRRNSEGMVVGLVYAFTGAGLRQLGESLKEDWSTAIKGAHHVNFDVGPFTIGVLQDALREIVEEFNAIGTPEAASPAD